MVSFELSFYFLNINYCLNLSFIYHGFNWFERVRVLVGLCSFWCGLLVGLFCLGKCLFGMIFGFAGEIWGSCWGILCLDWSCVFWGCWQFFCLLLWMKPFLHEYCLSICHNLKIHDTDWHLSWTLLSLNWSQSFLKGFLSLLLEKGGQPSRIREGSSCVSQSQWLSHLIQVQDDLFSDWDLHTLTLVSYFSDRYPTKLVQKIAKVVISTLGTGTTSPF